MKILGNIIWVVFGGLEMAVAYFCIGLLLMITIIGIPASTPCGWSKLLVIVSSP